MEHIYSIAEKHELYAPNVPVTGGGLFTLDYAREHRTELEKVYGMLADEQSRRCLLYTSVSGCGFEGSDKDLSTLNLKSLNPGADDDNTIRITAGGKTVTVNFKGRNRAELQLSLIHI